jgi:hypothetical protein
MTTQPPHVDHRLIDSNKITKKEILVGTQNLWCKIDELRTVLETCLNILEHLHYEFNSEGKKDIKNALKDIGDEEELLYPADFKQLLKKF